MKFNHLIFYFLLCILFINCERDKNPCSLSDEVLRYIYEVDSIVNVPKIKERLTEHYKQRFNEPHILDSKNETYRFQLNSSFNDDEIYRIEKRDDSYYATVKILDAKVDSLKIFKENKISKITWEEVTNNLEANNFWTYRSRNDEPTPFLDGASWQLEGYKPIKDKCTFQNYHVIVRYSTSDSIFMSMCNSFRILKEE